VVYIVCGGYDKRGTDFCEFVAGSGVYCSYAGMLNSQKSAYTLLGLFFLYIRSLLTLCVYALTQACTILKSQHIVRLLRKCTSLVLTFRNV
jgi:hypothetical protein